MTSGTGPRVGWVGSAVLVVLATAVLVSVALGAPPHRELAARVYLLLVTLVAVRLLVRAIRGATWRPGPHPFDVVLHAPLVRDVPPAQDPRRIAQDLGAAAHRALELHYRLRPRLRKIAADRLAAHHGVALDGDLEEARRLLGPAAWELLRPDREPPADRLGPGMPLPELAAIVTALERL